MRADLILLCLAYVLSQFFRAFLAVLSQVLKEDIGATAEHLASASGLWFLVFAAMQIPVGVALDRYGPRRTSGLLLLIGGAGGAALFAVATTPTHVSLAMALIGIGCSPVLMASFYIFARSYPPARFATLAALMIGIGSIGNIVAAYPMAWAAETIGWRAALWGLAGISGITAISLWIMVQDPPHVHHEEKGSVLDLLKIPALWLILPLLLVNYLPVAGVRGLWIGPYLTDTFALTTGQIGQASLVMGLAMIIGTLAYGPADRIFGTRKWVVVVGNSGALAALFALTFWHDTSPWFAIAMMATLGFFGTSFPLIVAHGRSFIPPHLLGRGVTLLNLFGIGGVGVMQFGSGRLHSAVSATHPTLAYQVLFATFGALLLIGLLIYLFSQDRTD
ncbi:MFS transporter [Shimia sp.]|uniref:MFS transporter n=1 Tax=Shimia sp. TaxID=1954381 RepID=UPI0032974B19